MRVTSILIALSLLAFTGWSQETEPAIAEADTTRVSMGGGTEFMIIKKKDDIDIQMTETDSLKNEKNSYDEQDFTYWSGLDIGFVGLDMTDEVKEANEWLDLKTSMVVNLNVVETKIPLIKHYLGINTGLGISWQNYSFRDDSLSLIIQGDSLVTGVTSPFSYSKNKLRTSHIKVPLLVEINTSKTEDKNFHIAAGLIGGWNYRTIYKQRYEFEGDKVKQKTKGDYFVNPWSLEATARVGYGDFNLFATASLTSLFEEDKGPEAYPFTVGLTITSF